MPSPTRSGSTRRSTSSRTSTRSSPSLRSGPAPSETSAARSPAGVRLHAGRPRSFLEPMAVEGRRSDRLDGHRHADRRAVEPRAPALRLFQAELRPGHQPADRPDPRGTGDEPAVDDRPAPQPARPRGRHAQAAGSRPADPDQRRPREDPLGRGSARRRVPHRDDRHHLGRRAAGAEGLEMAIKEMCWAATEAVLQDQQHPDPVRPRARRRTASPMPALLATAAVHHHLVRQGLRMQTGLVVETGEAREVHHFCVLAGYGAEAINPYLAFETLEDIRARKKLPELDADEVAEELHQGGRQGHPQGHVQDGHLDLPVLLRRADLRRGRPVERVRRQVLHRHRDHDRRRRPDGSGRGSGAPPRARPMATTRSTSTCSMSAASTSSACAARTTPGPRTTSPTCSTRCAATARRITRSSRKSINEQSERLLTIRGLMEFKQGRRRRSPLDEVEPAERNRQALLHRRDELRLDQPRGAHHAGHRDEPHRRTLEHRRRRRGAGPLQADGQRRFDALAASSRSPRAASA